MDPDTHAPGGNGAAPVPALAIGVDHRIEHWPLARLVPNPRNPRVHTPEQVKQIAQVIAAFGWTYPILVDELGLIIAGHGRRDAAVLLKSTTVPVLVARGWTDDQKRAYAVADNRLNELSWWDDDLLRLELGTLQASQFDLNLTGFTGADLEAALSPGDEDADDADRGALLELVSITIADPVHVVERGHHYLLSERHHLLCVGVIAQWNVWAPLLKGDALFCPYPGVFVPFGHKAAKHALVLVQPDPYIAGHILDRWCEVHGEAAAAAVVAP